MANGVSKSSTGGRIYVSSLTTEREEANAELFQTSRNHKEKKTMSNNCLELVQNLNETPNIVVSKTGVMKTINRKAWMDAQLALRPDATKKLLKSEYRDVQGNFARKANMTIGAVNADPNTIVTSFRVKRGDDGRVKGYSANWKIANSEESGSVARQENSDLRKQNAELKRMIEELKNSKQS